MSGDSVSGDDSSGAANPGDEKDETERMSLSDLRSSVIWQTLRGHRWLIAVVGVLGALNGIVVFLTVETTKAIIDEAIVEGTADLSELVGDLRGLAIMLFIVGLPMRQLIARAWVTIEFELRTHIHDLMLRADPRRLDTVSSGQVLTRLLTDFESLQTVILMIPGIAFGLILLLVLSVYLAVLQPQIAVLGIIAIPLNIVLLRRLWPSLSALSWLNLHTKARVTTAIDEQVRGVRVVRAFGREKDAEELIARRAGDAYSVGMTRVRLLARYDVLLKAVPVLLDATIMFFALRLLISGSMTPGTYLVFVGVAGVLTAVAQGLDELGNGAAVATSGTARLLELLEQAGRSRPDGPDSQGPPPAGALVVENAAYADAEGTPVGELTLRCEPGELAVLVGASDLAKHSVAATLSGERPAAGGHLHFAGLETTAFIAASRRSVRVLDEQPYLFGRTVRENLEVGLGRELTEADGPLVAAALHAAGFDTVLAGLPQGAETVLADRGLTLSGGERQRLSLARALLEPPALLILDDALSAVDPALELELLARIRRHSPATVVVLLTRRPSARRAADHVCLLADPDPAVVAEEDAVAAEALAAEARESAARVGGGRVAGDFDEDAPSQPALRAAVDSTVIDDADPDLGPEVAADPHGRPSWASVLGPFRRWVFYAGLALLVFTLAGLAKPALDRLLLDAAGRGDTSTGDWVVLAVVAIGLVTGSSGFLLRITAGRVNRGIQYLLQRRTFARLSRLGLDTYDRESPGDIATKVVRDLDVVSTFADSGLYMLAVSLALFAGTLVVLALWSTEVAAAVLPFVALLVLATLIQVPLANRAYDRARVAVGRLIRRTQEDLAGRDVVAGFGAEGVVLDAFDISAGRLRRASKRALTIANVYDAAVATIAALATAALLEAAGDLALADALSVGSVVALYAYLGRAMLPVQLFAANLRFAVNAQVSLHRLGDLYAVDLPEPDECEQQRLDGPGAVAFSGVSFRYPGTDARVLDHIDFDVRPGELVAVVGPTGAGKSSVAKLLVRVYSPEVGAVTLDGADIGSLEPTSYRSRVGVVPQDAFLFRGTVRSNISYARPDAGDEEVMRVVELVGATDELAILPDGLDTVVDEEGRNLLPSHRQLIALARAWMVQPDILVLDEATASLEPVAERAAIDAVRRLGSTTLMVAHRLAVAEAADRVVVMRDGRVVQVGPHEQLLAEGGFYASLWGLGPTDDATEAPQLA